MPTETESASGSARTTTDHEEIRRWVESRGGRPACVVGTGGRGDTGMLRIDMPGGVGGESLQEISWNEWFEAFEENNLAFLYQDDGQSRFNKLVSRSSAGGTSGGRSGGRRSGGANRGAAARSSAGGRAASTAKKGPAGKKGAAARGGARRAGGTAGGKGRAKAGARKGTGGGARKSSSGARKSGGARAKSSGARAKSKSSGGKRGGRR